jgi:DNA-binding MarR family transcriptional regulator
VKIPRRDHVDDVRAAWSHEWPELDTSPIDVVARAGRLARYFDNALDRVFSAYGLRREAWDVLASLRRSGPPYRASPTDLYQGLMRTSGAMTNRLYRLERAGLVRRIPDPHDARGLLVELTTEGHRLVDEIAPEHLANERALLSPLTAVEQRTLADLMAKLLANLEAREGTPPATALPKGRRRRREEPGSS